MAVIGDILVKLVGDFAQFSKGMEENTQKLDAFGQAAADTNSKLAGFASLVQKGIAAIGIASLVSQMQQYADNVQKAAVDTANLARSVNLTITETQALQALAAKTGDSFSDLAKKGAENRDWLAKVVVDAEAAGQVMDSAVIQRLKTIQVESDEASRRMQVFFAPAIASTKSWIAESLERIASDLATVAMHEGILDKLMALGRMLGYGGGAGAAGQFRLDEAQRIVDDAQAVYDRAAKPRQTGIGLVQPDPADVAAAQKALDAARTQLGQLKDAQAKAAYGPMAADALGVTVTATRLGGGGGGRTDDQSLQAQIDRYNALEKAAKKAYDTIQTGTGQTIEDLKRQVTVQQQVDEIAGKLGAKYSEASEAQKKALYDAVAGAEQQRAATQKLLDTEIAATETQKKYGDGSIALAKVQKDLNEQLATRRLNTQAATRADKAQTEAIQQQALAAQRYDDSLGSLAAGFQSAANQAARANDLFSVGGNAFNSITGAMVEGLDVLAGKSSKTFGDVAADFALMLAKMTAAAALSKVAQYVFGLFGGSEVAAVAGPVGGYTQQMLVQSNIGPVLPITGRQGGGDVYAGNIYRVNEQQSEYFMPKGSGTIVPLSERGQSGDVTVNIDMGKVQGARDPQSALDFGRKVKAAVVDVIHNEKRPGGSLYTRLSN